MAFARWDPIRDLLAIHQRLDHLAPSASGWMPPVDVHETPDSYVVTAEVPGVVREDIDIRVNDGWVTLAGTRRELGRACERYHRVERGHGAFARTFELPAPVDTDGVTAELHDGILTVTLPKSPGAAPRRIPIG